MMNVEKHQDEIEFWLKQNVYAADNFHSQFAPIKLSIEMINKLNGKVNWKTSEIAIFYDCSLLMVVYEKVKAAGGDVQNITFFCSFMEKKRFAETLEVKVEYVEQRVLVNWLKEKQKMEFDVVIGNPPYQGGKTGGGDGSGNAIWQHFVNKSFQITNENGYVCLVHPSTWRFGKFSSTGKSKSKFDAQSLLFSKQIIFLKMYFDFPSETADVMVDYYVAQNTNKLNETEVECLDGLTEITIPTVIGFLSHYQSDLIKSILVKVFKTEDNGLKARKSWGGLSIKDETSPAGNYQYLKGSRFFNGNIAGILDHKFPHIHQYDKKVIIADSGPFSLNIFDDGHFGIDDHVHYVLVENDKQGRFLSTVLKSTLGEFLYKIFSVHKNNLSNSPYPISRIKLEEVELSEDVEVFRHFKLTEEEIKLIKIIKEQA